MHYTTHMPYDRASAPRVGLVTTAIDAFSAEGKAQTERKWSALFHAWREAGVIHADSLMPPRISGPHQALAIADDCARALVDVIIIVNSAFPNGHVFPTIALHPHLQHTPVILTAEYEAELGDREWTTNAWCGVIMNNAVARRVGRPVRPLAGDPASAEFQHTLKMLFNSYRAVAQLRREVLGRFGDAPGGFHSATMDQYAFLRTFGVRLETVDLLALMSTYHSGKATGYCGEATFTDEEVTATMAAMREQRVCQVSEAHLRNGARFYHALKAQIDAQGFTSIAVKCWPELLAPEVNIAACFPMSWLLTNGVVRGVGCEADCPTAVLQSLGALLTGAPAACLDFVNHTGRCPIVELGHCGVGIAGQMGEGEAIAYKSPDRQGGDPQHAPALIGQFAYGPKTGMAITQTASGQLQLLAFTGENCPDTAQGKLYCAADLHFPAYQQLDRLILQHGFPHHLAVAMADITQEVKEVCDFLGIQYANPMA
jgi:L-fucose isomerase-like protein